MAGNKLETTEGYPTAGNTQGQGGGVWQIGSAGVLNFAPGAQQTNDGTQASAVADLTDSTGGTANDTLTAVGGLTTLTDSTGGSGTHDDTLADPSVPADLTGGESPTEAEHNAALAALRIVNQNGSDTAQKVIEVVADLEDCKNNFADIAAKVNGILAALRGVGIIASS